MTHSPNRLNPAVSGDTNDLRTFRLLGVESIPVDATCAGEVWRTGTDPAELTVTRASANEVTVDLGEWLADNPATGDWWVELDINGTTWPASAPATLPVRADAP